MMVNTGLVHHEIIVHYTHTYRHTLAQAGGSVFLQSLPDDSHPLLVSLRGGRPLVRPDILRTKPRDPHVPAALQHNLHVPHVDGPSLAVLSQGARLAHSLLYKIICYLQEDILNIIIQLLCRVNFLD